MFFTCSHLDCNHFNQGEIMKVTLNQTDNYKLRLNVQRVESMKDMYELRLESQLTTAKSTDYQTAFSTTVSKMALLELAQSLDSFLFMEH
jgi:hypothetical protein